MTSEEIGLAGMLDHPTLESGLDQSVVGAMAPMIVSGALSNTVSSTRADRPGTRRPCCQSIGKLRPAEVQALAQGDDPTGRGIVHDPIRQRGLAPNMGEDLARCVLNLKAGARAFGALPSHPSCSVCVTGRAYALRSAVLGSPLFRKMSAHPTYQQSTRA